MVDDDEPAGHGAYNTDDYRTANVYRCGVPQKPLIRAAVHYHATLRCCRRGNFPQGHAAQAISRRFAVQLAKLTHGDAAGQSAGR